LPLAGEANQAGEAVFELHAHILTGPAATSSGVEFVLEFFDGSSEPQGRICSTSTFEGAHFSPGEYADYVYSGLVPPRATQAWVELVVRPAQDSTVDLAFDEVSFSVSQ